MLQLGYDYDSCVSASERIAWRLDDVFPSSTRLEFGRPFLPASLAARGALPFLSVQQRTTLNQIMGNAYANIFAFVEEYILATMVRHAATEVHADRGAMRALLRFADEEVKHQMLFGRFCEAFDRDFGHECEVLGAAAEVAAVILSKSPIAVLTMTLHIELMTQAHYVECVRDDVEMDPLFRKVLHQHWLEESQHARIDALELDKLLDRASREAVEQGLDEYLEIVAAFDGLLEEQARMDARALAGKTNAEFTSDQVAALVAAQHAGYRRTFLVHGMTNATFASHVATMSAVGADRVRRRAEALSR